MACTCEAGVLLTEEVETRIRANQLLKILDATSDYFILEEIETNFVRYSNDPSKYQLGIFPSDEGGDSTFCSRLAESSQLTWKSDVVEAVLRSRIWTGEVILEPVPGHEIWVNVTCVGHKDERSGEELVSILAKDITAQKKAEWHLEHAANHDGLTGLSNRTSFFNSLDNALRKAKATQQRVAVMYCDLDGFKSVNDNFGHNAGDLVLNAVGERLLSRIREHDVVARFGGDEFVVLCTALPQSANIDDLARRLVDSVADPIESSAGVVGVGISIGVAYSIPGDSMDSVVTRADEALYIAKNMGKNQTYVAGSNRAVK